MEPSQANTMGAESHKLVSLPNHRTQEWHNNVIVHM